jgi:hypothetical protein
MVMNNRLPRTSIGKRLLARLLTAGVLSLGGCATIEGEQATDTERMLAAAGFEQKLADTPEKKAHLQTLSQLKLTPHKEGDQPRFVYADATYCQCLYVGDEPAYQRYKQLARQSSMADRQRQMTMWNSAARMNWGMWGSYRGGGL